MYVRVRTTVLVEYRNASGGRLETRAREEAVQDPAFAEDDPPGEHPHQEADPERHEDQQGARSLKRPTCGPRCRRADRRSQASPVEMSEITSVRVEQRWTTSGDDRVAVVLDVPRVRDRAEFVFPEAVGDEEDVRQQDEEGDPDQRRGGRRKFFTLSRATFRRTEPSRAAEAPRRLHSHRTRVEPLWRLLPCPRRSLRRPSSQPSSILSPRAETAPCRAPHHQLRLAADQDLPLVAEEEDVSRTCPWPGWAAPALRTDHHVLRPDAEREAAPPGRRASRRIGIPPASTRRAPRRHSSRLVLPMKPATNEVAGLS